MNETVELYHLMITTKNIVHYMPKINVESFEEPIESNRKSQIFLYFLEAE